MMYDTRHTVRKSTSSDNRLLPRWKKGGQGVLARTNFALEPQRIDQADHHLASFRALFLH